MLGFGRFGFAGFLPSKTLCFHNVLAESEKFFMAPLKVLNVLIRSSMEEASSMIFQPAREHNNVRSH